MPVEAHSSRCGRAPLRLHATAKRSPATSSLPALVGELRVGDRGRAAQLRSAERLEALVGGGVDARDEERGDRGDPVDRLAGGGAVLQPREPRLGDRGPRVEREQQRDVDVDPLGDRRADRRDALRRAGDLDHHVRAVAARPQVARHRERRPPCRARRSARPRARRSRRRRRCAPRRAAARRRRPARPRSRASSRSPRRRRRCASARRAARRSRGCRGSPARRSTGST